MQGFFERSVCFRSNRHHGVVNVLFYCGASSPWQFRWIEPAELYGLSTAGLWPSADDFTDIEVVEVAIAANLRSPIFTDKASNADLIAGFFRGFANSSRFRSFTHLKVSTGK